MTEEVIPTPEGAVIPEVIETVETPKTMEQILETPEVRETVGLDKFLELKKQNKELARSMKDLEAKISEGATHREVSADIESLSSEYPDVDKNFLNKLASTIRNQVEKDADEKISSRLRPLEAKEKAEKIDTAFNTHFNLAIEKMPEFKGIVNPDVIKTLSLDAKNANKTFSQIIEDTYGSALTGKRTIETTTPGGGKDAEVLNYDKARKDSTYFDQVMDNPRLKREYNDQMLKNGI